MVAGDEVMEKKYNLIFTENTFCPKCNKSVWLLSPENPFAEMDNGFYVCFPCESIGQVGVGPVEKVGGGKNAPL